MERFLEAVGAALATSGRGLRRFCRLYVGAMVAIALSILIFALVDVTTAHSMADLLVGAFMAILLTLFFSAVPVAIVCAVLLVAFGGART